MRFMLILKSDPSVPQPAPEPAIFEAMGKYNQELAAAGALLGGEGLHAEATRIRFSDGKRTITDGPFTESKEMIAGYWMIKVKSKEEALSWALRVPGASGEFSHLGPFNLELRQVHEDEDLAAICPPEVLEKERELRRQLATARA